jgi:N-acetylglucosamine kinase-like BadF-type ATPase
LLEVERGYGKKTTLTRHFKEQFGTENAMQIISSVENGEMKPFQLSKFSKQVFISAYEENDPVSRKIVHQAARRLSHLILIGVESLSISPIEIDSNWPIYVMGGTFKNKWANQFTDLIKNEITFSNQVKVINVAEENPATYLVKQCLKNNNECLK